MRLDVSLTNITKVSFEQLEKSLGSKSHEIGEKLVKPAAITFVRTMRVEDIQQLELVALSDNTVFRRILNQFVNELKKAVTFSLQIDETLDIGSNPQLIVFVRFKFGGDIGGKFLFFKL